MYLYQGAVRADCLLKEGEIGAKGDTSMGSATPTGQSPAGSEHRRQSQGLVTGFTRTPNMARGANTARSR